MVEMNYRRIARLAPELSVDSLVDIFMNAFAIVMFSSIALALSLSPQNNLNDKAKQTNLTTTIKLKLPLTRNVSTDPIYIWIRADGAKIINYSSHLQWKTTNRTGIDGQIKVEPILNSSISPNELNYMAKNVNIIKSHIIFLVHPNGVQHYKEVREIFERSNVPSGWIPWSQDTVFLTSSGRTPSEVQ